MKMSYNLAKWLCFLIGLGCKTQIFFLGGCIGISELVLCVVAPFVFLRDIKSLHRSGFGMLIWLFASVVLGCLVSSFVNNTPGVYTYKAFAMVYATFAALVVFHRLLQINPNGIGWYIVGYAVSSVITIWAFHPIADIQVGYIGAATTEYIVGSVMFWIKKVREFAIIPVCLIYFKTPIPYSVGMPIVYSVYSMLASSSGRSMALGTIGASALILIGGKSRKRMRFISHHLGILVISAVVIVAVFNFAYKQAATNGILGEQAYNKYQAQSSQGESAIKILMSGRKEFFLSLPACIDHPILGLGPRAEDNGGYVSDFLSKYGTPEEFAYYCYLSETVGYRALPCHSYLTSFWLWFGAPGLIFWLYVFWLIYKYYRNYIDAVPQWFGYFSLNIPMLLWDIFFSPYSWRINNGLMLCALLLSRAYAQRRILLPEFMEREARMHEN